MPSVAQETNLQTVGLECLAAEDTREALRREVRRGLIVGPRSLSPWMFYDAEGSALFERITNLPEYYPTRDLMTSSRIPSTPFIASMPLTVGDGVQLQQVVPHWISKAGRASGGMVEPIPKCYRHRHNA
jgi:hypothetical protein